VDRLRSLLTEAKFQHYLIDQRTLALLGLASDIFGQLSDGQFGFGPEFQIVSRASNASRSPKTLSGGETFLASLALALALVELYSRTGTRLGALFLDEGFGSLDVDPSPRRSRTCCGWSAGRPDQRRDGRTAASATRWSAKTSAPAC
jgi:DNA repair exonuclease SbcCD ATPase subunit